MHLTPINRPVFGYSLGHRFLSGAGQQKTVTMVEQIRNDCTDYILMGISEGGLDKFLNQHILGSHQIPGFAVGVHTLLNDAVTLVVDFRFYLLERD